MSTPYEEEQPKPEPIPCVISPLITTQPGAEVRHAPGTVLVPLPAPIQGVPPGLEYLTMVDTIVVQQLFEFIEVLTGWETRNKYSLRNANGEQVYYAAEESDCCERYFCGPQRGFAIHIVDNFKREVITVYRGCNPCNGPYCCKSLDCCAQECVIECPPGHFIGSVKQRPGCLIRLAVNDTQGNTIFHIDAESCITCCNNFDFIISDMNGQEVGGISKKWRGIVSEAFTDADIFSVNFPMNLDVRMKAILLGATFLIDFMAFEK